MIPMCVAVICSVVFPKGGALETKQGDILF